MTKTHHLSAVLILSTAPFWSGCTAPASDAQVQIARVAPPAVTAGTAEHRPGLHQVVTYGDGLVCGGAPEGEEGLRSIAAMGIKTVISVDGAAPDVATAEKLGLRYVHLPISYSGFPDERGLELAQAVANLPGPIYLHCHHGKHRSAGALAAAGVMNGLFDNEHAQARMKVSGTAADYQGLWQEAKDARPMPKEALRADPAKFPSVSKVSGLVAIMTEVDIANDNLKAVQKAGWQVPKDHPDLVPAKESARLETLYTQMHTEPDSTAKPAEYQDILKRSHEVVRQLDAAIRSNQADAAEKAFAAVQKSCKECHKLYRDQ
ncbi:MAG: cytochrome c [Planctomycetes bacterium]|nr:cytochrome c [Planctomycetota bacterium]